MAGIVLGLAFASRLVSISFSFIYTRLGLTAMTDVEFPRFFYFLGEILAGTFFVLFLNRLYSNALDCPSTLTIKRSKKELAMILLSAPWIVHALFKFLKIHSAIFDLINASHGNSHLFAVAKQTIHKTHLTIWQQMGWGVDWQGVVLAVLMSLIFPIFEERFCRGYLLSRLCQQFQPIVAALIAALVFMLAHLLIVRSVDQLFWIFFTGFSCGLVRLVTGRWVDALILHLLINFCVFLPKLYVAGVNFYILSH